VLVPDYVREDPTLAAVVDESHADRLCEELSGRTVRECLSDAVPAPPVAHPDDTALEVAALMARVRSPLVAVVDGAVRDGGAGAPEPAAREGQRPPDGRLLGVITASRLLERLLAAAR